RWIEDGLIKIPVGDLFFGSLGLIIGLVIAYLININLQDINLKIGSQIIPPFLTILLGYLGFQVGFRRREEAINLIQLHRKDRDKDKDRSHEEEDSKQNKKGSGRLVDTSVIIDGRIADICQTNFLERPVVIPQFVLSALQRIADSSAVLKRNRGRRGLDIL